MTEPTTQSDDPVQGPASGRGFAATVAPEGVAAVLAVALVGALLAVRLAGLGSHTLTPPPQPSDAVSPEPTAAGPVVDRAALTAVLGVNQSLALSGSILQTELDKNKVDPLIVKTTLTQMSQQLLAGQPAAARLTQSEPTALVGADLAAVYTELRTEIDQANDFKLRDEPAWRASAVAVVATLKALPGIDLRLRRLLAGLPDPNAPASSVPPSVAPESAAPTASPVVTAPPTPPPTNPPTAPPTAGTTVPPSGSPSPTSTPPLAEPNQLDNPGFEADIAPWQLLANPNLHPTVTADPTNPGTGKASARIDIPATDGLPQSVYLMQSGITLNQGANYRVSISFRSSVVRQIRLRVTSSTPPAQSYWTKTVTAGPAWTSETTEFITAVGGGDRLFVIEVGQAAGSVWIDDVSIARVSPFSP